MSLALFIASRWGWSRRLALSYETTEPYSLPSYLARLAAWLLCAAIGVHDPILYGLPPDTDCRCWWCQKDLGEATRLRMMEDAGYGVEA